MTFDLVFCPACGHCYPREDDAHTLPCGHSMSRAVKMKRETVGHQCEIITMKIRNSSQAEGTIMRRNGHALVEYRKKGYKNKSLVSLPAFLGFLEQRNPALLAAFRARGDVRRSAGGF